MPLPSARKPYRTPRCYARADLRAKQVRAAEENARGCARGTRPSRPHPERCAISAGASSTCRRSDVEGSARARSGVARDTEAQIGGEPPEEPLPLEEVLAGSARSRSSSARSDHPGFFAFIPGEPTWPGALADLYASALNLHATDWMESPGPTQVELTVIDWLRGWVGYPAEAGGVFGSGGSAANMTALACAREVMVGAMRDDVVAYVSDQAHSSLARAARILGFRPQQVRVLPVDERFRMRPELLAQAMDADLRAGRRPLFVAAAAGSTNTGAIDPLPELAEVCHERGAWFHVDAAYGGGALLSERGRTWLAGIELADSVTLDAHKWLYQPYECGVLMVRDLEHLHRAFEISPDYLKDIESALREPNFADLGMQLTVACAPGGGLAAPEGRRRVAAAGIVAAVVAAGAAGLALAGGTLVGGVINEIAGFSA